MNSPTCNSRVTRVCTPSNNKQTRWETHPTDSTHTLNTNQPTRPTKPSHSLTVKTWAGRLILANCKSIMSNMDLTVKLKPRNICWLKPSLHQILKRITSKRNSELKVVKSSNNPSIRFKNGPRSTRTPRRSQTLFFLKSLTSETLTASISLTHLETKVLAVHATQFHLLK